LKLLITINKVLDPVLFKVVNIDFDYLANNTFAIYYTVVACNNKLY